MSEELKDKADAFCGSRGIVCPNDWMVVLMAEFASQVCEQSQREIDRLGDTFEDYRIAVETQTKRAEAAELALLDKDRAFKVKDWELLQAVNCVTELKAALQAKEQELAQLRLRLQK